MFGAKIGVLGGIGPEATGEFYRKLILKFQGSGAIRRNADFPQIIVNSIPAPELLRESVSGKDLREYARGLKELDVHKPDFIVMACNTVHLFREQLQGGLRAPILDLRHEVRGRLAAEGVESLAVLGSPLVVRKGLFKFEGMRHIELTTEELERLSKAVFLFNKGVSKEEQAAAVRRVAARCLGDGAEKLVLGCTEVAVILDGSVPAINTLDVLAEAACRRALGHRGSEVIE